MVYRIIKNRNYEKKELRNSVEPSNNLLPANEKVQNSIVLIRQQNVISDADVANLYGVETKRVNEAVKNNPDKFPEDYMFILTKEELHDLRTKFSTTKVSTKSRTMPRGEERNGTEFLYWQDKAYSKKGKKGQITL